MSRYRTDFAVLDLAERSMQATRHIVDATGEVVDEVVTCSECLYCASPADTRWCAKFGAYKPSADGFCAWGEMRGK